MKQKREIELTQRVWREIEAYAKARGCSEAAVVERAVWLITGGFMSGGGDAEEDRRRNGPGSQAKGANRAR